MRLEAISTGFSTEIVEMSSDREAGFLVAPTPEQSLEAERELMMCSIAQAEIALSNAGLLIDVEALMAQESTPAAVKIAWRRAVTVKRTGETVAYVAQALSLFPETVDDLFRDAMTINL